MTTSTPRRLHLTTLLVVLLGLVLPSAASAHRASNYYDVRWFVPPVTPATPEVRALEWVFAPSFEEEARPDGLAATEAWNAHATRLVFLHAGEIDYDPGIGQCNLDGPNVARRGAIDGPSADGGGILAVAAVCVVPGTDIAYHFTVTYDTTEPWHFGAPPIPADRFDLQGILAHEFGHATGWLRHFNESEGTECIEALRHTMCSTASKGTADPRDLEPHDIDTWHDAY